MLSDVCLYVAYIGPKSRTERPEQINIGTGSSRHTSLGYHFQGQKVTRPLYSPRRLRIRQLQQWLWERIHRGNLLLRCGQARSAWRRFGAHGRRRGAGHIVAAAAQLQLVGFYWTTSTVQSCSDSDFLLQWNSVLGLCLSVNVTHIRLGCGRLIIHNTGYVLLNVCSIYILKGWDLAEVCALLSALLV